MRPHPASPRIAAPRFLAIGPTGAAGLTIGGAYATGNTDTTKQIFGVTGGSMALLGTLLVAIGGMVQNHYSDIGCVTRLDVDKHE
jgi:hypothetical protein